MALVSVTRLRVRSWRYLGGFIFHAFRTALQASVSDGACKVVLFRDKQNAYWTCTVWQNEKPMNAFVSSGVHVKVMPKLMQWCDEASVVHWRQAETSVPSWNEIHRRMQSEGRRAKVSHPSEAHIAYQIAMPQVRRGSQIRFK
jgi:hypothetical protein